MKKSIFLLTGLLILLSCVQHPAYKGDGKNITEAMIQQTIDSLQQKFGSEDKFRIEKGVHQVASLWRESDGSPEEFHTFCISNFTGKSASLDQLFEKIQDKMEILNGNYNKMTLELKWNVDVDRGTVDPIDEMYAAYDPSSHLQEDMYANKIAFIVALNFPHYTLKEKQEKGENWTEHEWAYARMGDVFTARVPSDLILKNAQVSSNSDIYISNYNIYAGRLLNKDGKPLFPADMVLLSHWNLRDEIKANYGKADGLPKQELIYKVMQHIINQDIPKEVINSGKFLWNPYTNKIANDTLVKFTNNIYTSEIKGEYHLVDGTPEGGERYQQILDNFHALKAMDPYYSDLNTYILRKCDGEMELTVEETENLCTSFLSSPEMAQVAKIIENRLGRPLQPFDIWYDGFKSRSSLGNLDLDGMVAKKYPTAEAYAADIPNMLMKVGFSKEKADFIASHISVDPARGSGHAWGAAMHSMNSHLRTRVGKDGMNYKGYNIAVHEMGHNVEQTISMHDVPDYMMNGVPNTAFTEACAFLFQARDLMLLGIRNPDPLAADYEVLDKYWASCEIMGVSQVDIRMWKWLYENPEATKEQLQTKVIQLAKDVWNQYFAPVYGIKDVELFAIYSHMVSYPMYLPAYAVGGIIQFQIEEYMQGKNFATEVERIYSQGRLIPQVWMKKAVGSEISTEPLIEKTKEVLSRLK